MSICPVLSSFLPVEVHSHETHSSLDPLDSGCGDPIIQRIVGSFDIDSVAGGLVDTTGGDFSIVTDLS